MAAPPSGWLPDPQTPGQLRYWDGVQWTPETEPASPATPPKQKRAFHKKPGMWVVASLLVVVVIAAVVSGPLEESVLGKKSASERGEDRHSARSDCKNTADAECTPRVGPDEGVSVDALIWQITGAEISKKIGDQELGLGEKADGAFVIVMLKVRSKKNQSATLNDNVIQLEPAGGEVTYDADSDGTLAAMGDGEDPLFYEDIGPNQTTETKVVFDVPEGLLAQDLFVRFNELGRGEPHGYIRLPKPRARGPEGPTPAAPGSSRN